MVKIASENSINQPTNGFHDQQNHSSDSFNNIINRTNKYLEQETTNNLNNDLQENNVNNNFINQETLLNNNNNNNQINIYQSNLPILNNSNHCYANVRNYMNSEIFDNSFIIKDDSPLIKKEFEFELGQTNVNSNYVKLKDLQLQLKNKNNLVNPKNILNLSFKELEPRQQNDYKLREPDVNYTTLDIKTPENDNYTFVNSNTTISTAPPTPINKTLRQNDFKTTSEPNSPNEVDFRRQQDSNQQYSLIDFDKTKALKSVINDKNN